MKAYILMEERGAYDDYENAPIAVSLNPNAFDKKVEEHNSALDPQFSYAQPFLYVEEVDFVE